MQALTIGGEVELLLALLGHPDIGDDSIVFAGGKPQRPVGPGDSNQLKLKAETISHRKRIVRIGTHHGLGVRRIGRERWSARCNRDREFARGDEFEIFRDGGDRCGVFFYPDPARLVWRKIEDISCESRPESGDREKNAERDCGKTRGECHSGSPIK